MTRFLNLVFVAMLVCLYGAVCFGLEAIPAKVKDPGQVSLPKEASSDWWSIVQKNIRKEEYNLSPAAVESKALYQAPNRANGFRSSFMEKGIEITPLSDEKRTWSWGLELITTDKATPGVSVKDNRMEYIRNNITEWYVNDEKGLEQGFTILKPADVGANGCSPMQIDLKLTGNLHPKFAEDGQAIDFYYNGNVSVLTYSKLKVTDATGKNLPSKFEPINGGIRISVDDKDAVYPITVDPLATSPSWTATGEAASNYLGYSIATAGDVNGDGYSDVVIGAYGFSASTGKAYLYLGGPAGLSVSPSWTAVGGSTGEEFGTSLATAGDVNGDGYSDVIVGAPSFSRAGFPNGKAYLYLGNPSGLSTAASWSVVGGSSDYFGCSVATAGDVNGDGYSDVIIGAYGSIKAYLFLGGATGLSTNSSWVAAGEGTNNFFGYSVSTAGDVNGDGYSDVIVGAYGYSTNMGKAYLYLGGPFGLSTTTSWTAVGEGTNNFFGHSVATAGDINGDGYSDVIVGSYGYDSLRGKAYLYLGGPSGLSTSPSWQPEGENASDRFGSSVATGGDVNGDGYSDVLIGSPNASGGLGKTYLYLGGPSGLPTASWSTAGEASGSSFGSSVATAGDVNGDGYSDVLVGALGFSSFTGKAYLYLGGASGLSASAWSGGGEAVDNYFGYAVATAGDVNGDGHTDVVAGAQGYGGNRGKAYLYLGGPSGLSATSSWSVVGDAVGDYFGIFVATAGDVNGDGYADVLIGAPGNSGFRGKAYLYLGGSSGLSTSAAWSAVGETLDDEFGRCVASAGDVNGDGYSDVVVGAYGYAGDAGKAYLYLGSALGLSAASSWTAAGEAATNNFGYSLATAGDVNGDGYADVVVGAVGFSSSTGKAYLYLGGPSGLSTTASWTAAGAATGCNFGQCVATAGDVNGDGYSDVLIGAPYSGSFRGSAYLYLGKPSGLSATAAWTAAGENDYDEFGISVATGGDVNGDGYSDAVVGADGYGSYSGKAYLFLGGSTGLPAAASWSAVGEAAGDRLGLPVAAAGDVNGDGYSDVIIGACWFNSKAGKAYLYYGNGGPGVPFRPQQLRSDLSAPISAGGKAYEQKLRLGLTLKSAAGKVWSKLQWQVVPWGGVFAPSVNPVQSDSTWYFNPVRRTVPLTLPEDLQRYTWRARVKYHPAKSPFIPWSPWFTISSNGLYETDLLSTSATEPYPPLECVLPDEPCWLYLVTKSGSDYTLNWQDPNQPSQLTGWNIRRSNNAALPKSTWPLMGTNVADMDAGTANYQWTDHSGDDPTPSTVWYYEVTTYNSNCPAEGPF